MAQTHSNLSTSLTLIERVRALEPDAWQTLSHLYGPLVYRWARQCGLQSQDAADITQNVFVSILRGIERFSLDGPKATFRGWLWTITRNAVREFVRRQDEHPRPIGGSDMQHTLQNLHEISDDENGPFDDEIQITLIQRALGLVKETVEPRNWDAFWRTTVQGEPAVEVAEGLQMSATAVRQAKYRVLCRLRDLLADS